MQTAEHVLTDSTKSEVVAIKALLVENFGKDSFTSLLEHVADGQPGDKSLLRHYDFHLS